MRLLHWLLTTSIVTCVAGCAEVGPPTVGTTPPDPQPGPVAFTVPNLEFTGMDEGWPPRPKGRQNEQAIDTAGVKDLASASRVAGPKVQALKSTVQQDRALSEVLGERFEVLRAQSRGPQKLMGPPTGKVTVYSYTMNRAVDVHIQADPPGPQPAAGKVAKIVVREQGYQPPESANEIQHAVELAVAKLGGTVKDMESSAILAPDPQQTDHRVLYVTFRQAQLPVYWALVDLTTDTVLSNGKFARS